MTQPQGATNNGNLLIPNKQTMGAYDPTKYGTDMRAIERWCNSLIADNEVETILFQMSYTSTGCGPAVFGTTLAKLNGGGAEVDITFTPLTAHVKILATAFCNYQTVDNSAPAGIVLSFVDTTTGAIQEMPLELVATNTPSGTRVDTIGGKMVYEGISPSLTPGTEQNWTLAGYKLANTGTANMFASPGTSTAAPFGPIVVTVYDA